MSALYPQRMPEPELPSSFPTPWIPQQALSGERASLPIPVPEDSWLRLIEDPARGLPYLCMEAFWITDPVMHVARCAGWTADDHADGVDERALVSHERISMETIESYNYQFTQTDDSGEIVFTGGEIRTDLPLVPIMAHYDAHDQKASKAPQSTAPATTVPDRADIAAHGSHLTLRGQRYERGRFNTYLKLGETGIQPCGLWIDGQRQYGVAIYDNGEWLFTVPYDRGFADFVYDQIETQERG